MSVQELTSARSARPAATTALLLIYQTPNTRPVLLSPAALQGAAAARGMLSKHME